MIERFERFTYATNEISKFWRKLAGAEMEKYGLNASHAIYFIVLVLHGASGLTAAQLCHYTGRDKADVSRMMRTLEQKELVTKEGTKTYKGSFVLTEKGQAIADIVCERASSAVSIADKGLSPEMRKNFYAAIDAIAASMRQMSEEGIPEL